VGTVGTVARWAVLAPRHRQPLRRALGKVSLIDQTIRRLRRSDEIAQLQAGVAELQATIAQLQVERRGDPLAAGPAVSVLVPPTAAPFLTEVPPGHFYSPVPDLADIWAQADRLFDGDRSLPGVDLRSEAQVALFRTLAALARDAVLEQAEPATRYRVDNPNYGVGDATMLMAMLRWLRPRRYLEVGSGYSTALALDVGERFLDGQLRVTAVEPFPDLVAGLARPGDPLEVLAQPVQEVPLARFAELGANDVLFIDSSHVLKTGSDVQYLYTEVLPILADGVHVHVHDIFWPFEYLRHWVEMGRAWNESYLLHAFLLHNHRFEIVLWNHYLAVRHGDVIAAELPEIMENPGGALWLRWRERRDGA
jgi:predicted O-methyltransferase YrrM